MPSPARGTLIIGCHFTSLGALPRLSANSKGLWFNQMFCQISRLCSFQEASLCVCGLDFHLCLQAFHANTSKMCRAADNSALLKVRRRGVSWCLTVREDSHRRRTVANMEETVCPEEAS